MSPYLRCLALLSLGATACASIETSQPGLAEAAQHWVGRPETELLTAKGEPSRTLTRSYEDGTLIEKTLEYRGAAALGNTPQAANRSRPVLVNGQWILLPDDSISTPGKAQLDCKLLFKVDAKRIVRSWQTEGKGCPP